MLFTGLRESDIKSIELIFNKYSIPFKAGIDPSMLSDHSNEMKNNLRHRSPPKIHHDYFLLDVEIHDLEQLPLEEKNKLSNFGLHYQLEEPDFDLHPEEEARIQEKIAPKKKGVVGYIMAALALVWVMMMIKNSVSF